MDQELTKEEIERYKERDRLFLLSHDELAKESIPNQYQRHRFECDIEANEWIKLLRAGFTEKAAYKEARIRADKIVANWKRQG